MDVLMSEFGGGFSLRYVGRRFNGARLPFDVLSDLPSLRDLIAALAKQEFRQRYPDRRRVPQGFDKSISFSLLRIEDGSACPIVALDNDVAQQNLPNIGDGMEGIVEKAFAQAVRIFDDSSRNVYPRALPQDVVRALSKFASNLQEGESIEFQGFSGGDGNVVSLDLFRRNRLLAQVRGVYTKELDGVGELVIVDSLHNCIQLRTEDYGEIRLDLNGISMSADHFDGSMHSTVEFSASAIFGANDEFRGIEEVYSVDLVRPYDENVNRCLSRLRDIAKIERGWLGDDQGEQLVHLSGVIATRFIFIKADLAGLFRIFPTEDGGVSIEFNKNKWWFAIEIMPDGCIEIDGRSDGGAVYNAKKFDDFSAEFFTAFDDMMKVSEK